MEFRIELNDGKVFTDLETFARDLGYYRYVHPEDQCWLTKDSEELLDKIIWEHIEKGKLPDYITDIFCDVYDFRDFVYAFEKHREVVNYDIEKGWERGFKVCESPISGKYYGIYYCDSRYSFEYEDYEFFPVESYEEVVTKWREK